MKKLVRVSTLIVAGLILFGFTNIEGDGNFEGVITYTIKMDGDTNSQLAQMMKGSKLVNYIKGDMSRSESNFGMIKTITITDKKKPNDNIILMELMGNKYRMKLEDSVKKRMEDNKPQVKYLDGTKTIEGYACKEAQATITGNGNTYTSDIYYTDQIPYCDNAAAQFKGLKGFPLSFSMSVNGINVTIVVTSVSKQPVSDDIFTVPTGYKLSTAEDIQKDMMSQVGGH